MPGDQHSVLVQGDFQRTLNPACGGIKSTEHGGDQRPTPRLHLGHPIAL